MMCAIPAGTSARIGFSLLGVRLYDETDLRLSYVILRVPYYVVFSRYTNRLRAFSC